MAKLILVKHSAPQVVPEIPSEQWNLSEEGVARCKPLAEKLRTLAPLRIVSSQEVKAVQTATEVSKHLGTDFQTNPDLGEHDRTNVPHVPSAQFISMMELFFRKPNELVLGQETAAAALSRLRSAIDELIAEKTGENLTIVSHGTVIALLVAHYTGKSSFQLWRQLKLPSLVVFSLPDFKLVEIVDRV